MGLLSLKHSKTAYSADFAVYGGAVAVLTAALVAFVPPSLGLRTAGLAVGGLLGWTAIEYVLHRFVLHGLQPFKSWHAEHHNKPTALICSPTLLSAGLILGLFFIPALLLFGLRAATALTLGLLTGYLAYSVIHHATHHWHFETAWFKRRKRWHALHHAQAVAPGYYGVTSGFWDLVFGSHAKGLARL